MERARRASKAFLAAALVASLVGSWPNAGHAAGAADELRPAIDRVLRILADPELKGDDKARERRAALGAVIESAIDFPEAARRALARHWRARTDAERDEFVALFKHLVVHSYIRMMEPYAGETVQVTGESQGDDVTTVLTRIYRRHGEPVPVDYRMHRKGKRWLVYDVLVERVSLVGNYRVQFDSIVQSASYDELVRRVRARVAELDHAPAAAVTTAPRRG
jgi:phospholipid transport system substrate-binding protein